MSVVRSPTLGSAVDGNLAVMRNRVSVRPLQQIPQAEQERGPLRAAVVHELDRLFPIRVLENDIGLAILPDEPKDDLGIQPLVGAAGATPMHQLSRFGGLDLHVAKAVFDEAAL